MESPAPAVNLTACQIHHIQYQLPVVPCDRCGQAAPAVDTATRTALDIALDGPVLLHVSVSVHRCAPCQHAFRAQPPFLRPDATYTNRVVTKAVQSVYHDGMAVRRVARRLARDFWVQPSEGMIRRWCKTYAAALDFVGDYQAWVVSEFSGILCVDEVYQDQLALLLAVDPAAPEGDRLVGYQLVHGGSVTQAEVAAFLARLAQAGVQPDQVITDGSPLYPTTLAQLWPQAAHQLCLFHQTRQVTKAVRQVLKAVRAMVPTPPPGVRPAQAPAPPPLPSCAGPPEPLPRRGRGRCRQEVRQRGIALVHRLQRQGLSIQGIARQLGIARATVRSWLREPAPTEELAASDRPGTADDPAAPLPRLDLVVPPAPPPAPWDGWEQVQQVRRAVGEERFHLLRRPEHRTAEDEQAFALLAASPAGEAVRLARAFLVDWYGIWRDEHGQRRSLAEAQGRYERWRDDSAYATLAPLRRVQARVDAAQFAQLSHFLRDPGWEATNNGAERMGRLFRHQQAPHFTLRTSEAIDHALKARACLHQATVLTGVGTGALRCGRGRRRGAATPVRAAA